MSDAMDPRHSGSAMPSGRWKARKVTTPDDIEAAAKRVFELPLDKLFCVSMLLSWEEISDDYRDYCRRIAAAALNVEKTR